MTAAIGAEGGAYDIPSRRGSAATSGSSGSDSHEGWGEFEQLEDELLPVPAFDPDLLPTTFRPWIVDVAERMQCPIDYPAAALLVVLATIVGRKVGIRPKRRDDWTVIANLFGAIVGRPSLLKTPAVRELINQLARLELAEKGKFEEETQKRLAEQLVDKAEESAASRAIKDAVAEGNREDARRIASEHVKKAQPRPVRRRYLVHDATVEKLGELLNESPNGFLCFRDELMGLLRSMEKEGHECDRAFYLEAWNGNGRFSYDRISRGTIDIEAAILSLFGCVQPGPLSQYLQSALRSGSQDDGFIQRFQILVWPDPSIRWVNVDRYPDTTAKNAAFEVFLALDRMQGKDLLGETPHTDAPGEIPTLRFDYAAQERFDGWREALEQRLRVGLDHPAVEAHLAKYRKLIPAVALLLHLAEGERGAVNDEALTKAIGWGVHLEAHARRLYGVVLNAEVAAARAIERRIRKGKLRDGFTLREVYRAQSANLDRDAAELGVGYLIELGWLQPELVKTRGAPRTIHRIHPDLLGQVVAPAEPQADDGGGEA